MTKIDLAKKLIEIADNLDDAHNVYDWGPGVYWSRDLREAAAALGAAEPPALQMPPEFKEGTTHPRSTYFSEPTRDPASCEMWMVRGPTEEYGMVYLPTYAGTKREVEEKVMDGARREGFKGTLQERLAFLEWEIVRGTFHVNRTGD